MRDLVRGALAATADRGGLERLASRVDAWEPFFAAADLHGARGVLFDALSGIGALPVELERREKRIRVLEAMLRDAHAEALARVLAALEGDHVRAVPLKGPLLAERYYPRPERRPSADLDLLVAPRDVERAIAALSKLGYGAERGARGRYYRDHHHHLHLEHPHLPMVELHYAAYRGFGVTMGGAPLLARAVRYERPRWSAWVLQPEDEVLYLAVHAASHRFERLGWLYDLKLLVATHRGADGPLDWSLVARRAEDAGLSAVLALTCELLASDLGVERAWGPAIARPGRLREGLARYLVESRRETSARFAFNTLLCATPARAARNVARLATRKLVLEMGHAEAWLGQTDDGPAL